MATQSWSRQFFAGVPAGSRAGRGTAVGLRLNGAMRVALPLAIGCWTLGAWATAFGIGSVASLGTREFWPGALGTVVVAVAAYVALETHPRRWSGSLAMEGGSGTHLTGHWGSAAFALGTGAVRTWAGVGAGVLVTLLIIRYVRDVRLDGGLAALELFAVGMAALWLAAREAASYFVVLRGSFPELAPGSVETGQDGEETELNWSDPGMGGTAALAGGEVHTLRVLVDSQRLESQRTGRHELPGSRWAQYVLVTQEIRALATDLRALSERNNLEMLDEIRMAIAAAADGLGPVAEGHEDSPLYPLETLAGRINAGPRARTILAAAFLRAMGYRVALLRVPDRLALAVAHHRLLSDLFFRVGEDPAIYAEITAVGWRWGDAPADARAVRWRVLAVE